MAKTLLETLIDRHTDDKFVQIHHEAETGIRPKLSKIRAIREKNNEKEEKARSREMAYCETSDAKTFLDRAKLANRQFLKAYRLYAEKRNVA